MFLFVQSSVLALIFNLAASQSQPVPILKQISRQNEDGSYSYGYEAGDQSFKIETKYPSGEIYGKYGYLDDYGKLHEIEYEATQQRGFQPTGTDVNILPPTSINPSESGNINNPSDDGQYREDPSIYYTDPRYTNGENYSKTSFKPSLINQYSTDSPHHSIHSTPRPDYQHQYKSLDSASYTVNYR